MKMAVECGSRREGTDEEEGKWWREKETEGPTTNAVVVMVYPDWLLF